MTPIPKLFAVVAAFFVLSVQADELPAPTEHPSSPLSLQAETPFRVAHFTDVSSPFAVLGKQVQRGLELGLEYATDGEMEVAGRTIEILTMDTAGVSENVEPLLQKAIEQQVLLAVSPTHSGLTNTLLQAADLRGLPVLLASAPFTDLIDPERYPRAYRTYPNTSTLLQASALALGDDGVGVCVIAPDRPGAQAAIDVFLARLATTGAKQLCRYKPFNEELPLDQLWLELSKHQGERVLFVYWPGADNPLSVISESKPEELDLTFAVAGSSLAELTHLPIIEPLQGVGYYYYELPTNEINDWLVNTYFERYQTPPDELVAAGMVAGLTIVRALHNLSEPSHSGMADALAGLRVLTPTGPIILDRESHEAIQGLYFYDLKRDPRLPWAVPELIREVGVLELGAPIKYKTQ